MSTAGAVIQEANQDVLKLTACLAAIFKFISTTSIYFRHIMCRRRCRAHVLHLGRGSQWQQSIDAKASQQWTLIILYDNNNSRRFLSGARKENFETCNLPPALRRLQCKKGPNPSDYGTIRAVINHCPSPT